MNKGIEIRVGGKYRSRGGHEVDNVEPYTAAVGPSPYRFRGRHGSFDVFYMPDGRAFPERESDLDIVEEIGAEHSVGSPDAPLRAKIVATFEDPAKWPMTDAERVALLRELYVMAKGGAR